VLEKNDSVDGQEFRFMQESQGCFPQLKGILPALDTAQPSCVDFPFALAPESRDSDFIVLADRPFACLRDTFGGRIGWTVRHSQSGYNAVRYHLLRYRGEQNEPLFAKWVGPLITPRRVIEHVIEGEEVGPLDSYVHDLVRRHEPETAARLRTVESTAMTPIPALVASPAVTDDIVECLRDALMSGTIQTELSATLEALMITRFAPVNPADYTVLLSQAREADGGGIARPAQSGR
jgi:ABC-type phosphate/phosphonate transport system substrate-binding protein